MCKAVHCKVAKPNSFIYVGRPTKWGNPFSHIPTGTLAKYTVKTREEAVHMYKEWITTQPDLIDSLHELKGKDLGCWCAPQACHADILIKLVEVLT